MLKILECKFADQVYTNYLNEQYSLKGCKSTLDLDKLYEYIDILKIKIELLKVQFKHFREKSLLYPSMISGTDLRDFYQKEVILDKCDKIFLEKIKTLI